MKSMLRDIIFGTALVVIGASAFAELTAPSSDDLSTVSAADVLPPAQDASFPIALPAPNRPLDAATAARILAARSRLDALMDSGKNTDIADSSAIAAADAAEQALAEARRKAGTLAWRLQQMRLYQEEIQTQGLHLPADTMLYELDQQRGFQERERNPATSIELLMRLAYATQNKTTFASIESESPVTDGDLKAGESFLQIGVLRSAKARRVLAWVLGRGQIILADSDIEIIPGD